jgi:hypothetical protein
MFLLETIIFILLSLLSLLSFVGYGELFTSRYKSNFLISFFFGLIITSLLITGIHFFIKINFYVSLLIICLGILLFFFNFNLKKILLKKNIIYLLIFLFLIPIFISHKYHEDFGYYHLPYLISLAEQKIIFGIANANIAYAHNSLWLNIGSIYLLPNNNFIFASLPTFLTYVCFILFGFKKNLELPKKKLSNYFLIISLFYLIIKFTRLSEYGNDLPSTIFSILSIFYFLKFSETTNLEENKRFFFFNFTFVIFSILIKFSSIPLLFLTIILFLRNYKILLREIFRFEFIIIYFLCFIFFAQQFIYSGCFIFPTKFSCFNVTWFNDEILFLREKLELTNKSYSSVQNIISKEDYLNNFNWISFWFQRNYIEILEHVVTMCIPIGLLYLFSSKQKEKIFLKFKNQQVFFLFLIISFIFWLEFSPVYRFAIPYFLSTVFILTVNIFYYRKLPKKIFIIFFCIAIAFNFSKNISRISNKDKIYYGIEKINNLFITEQSSVNKFIDIYTPDIKNNINGWQGILCWDIPFACTYNKIRVDKKNGYLFFFKLNN